MGLARAGAADEDDVALMVEEAAGGEVPHRTVRTTGALSHRAARLMVFKLTMAASKTWRRLKGENRLPLVIAGVRFTDGVADPTHADQRAA
jgi:hypothetical protein